MEVKKIELVGAGTVEMLRPLLMNFAGERGEWLTDQFVRENGPTYVFFAFGWPVEGSSSTFGTAEIQQLPNNRVLFTFAYRRWIDMATNTNYGVSQEDYERFDKFVNDLFVRLVQLGFVELQEAPKVKPPLGFKQS